MKAVIKNSIEIVELLLTYGANPRLENAKGETALSLACMNENYQIVERIITAKGDVNKEDPLGRTPLLKSARHNNKSQVI